MPSGTIRAMGSVTSSTLGPVMASSQPLSMTGREAMAGLSGMDASRRSGRSASLRCTYDRLAWRARLLTWLSESGSDQSGSLKNGDAWTWSPDGPDCPELLEVAEVREVLVEPPHALR